MRGKRVWASLLCLFFALCLTSCTATMSFTMDVDNGDVVKVTLDVANGSRLSLKDGVLSVERDGQEILNGNFVHFEEYLNYVLSFEDLEVFEITPEDDFPIYYFFIVDGENGEEYGFLSQVEGLETGVILHSSGITAEEAETAFRQFHFEAVQ